VWSVYVIELDPHEAPSFRGYLYVGMTSKAPEIRVEEHRMGQRTGPRRTHSLKAHRHFVRRRTDLEPKRKYFSLESALRAESATRIALEAKGFTVIGGTERLPKD
jgi:predicted GIY-YIG superfamily endonuclease